MPVHLFDESDDREVGVLSDEQFQFLSDNLQAEDPDDDDYYLNQDTLEMLRAKGAEARLLDVLREAMGARGEIDIRWQRDEPQVS